MAKKCSYTYLDEFGNPSIEYYANEAKYGEDVARAMYISKQLKNDTQIRYSKDIDVRKELMNRTSPKELSSRGYIGPTSLINNSTNDPDKDNRILGSGAIGIKMRDAKIDWDTSIDYFKYDSKTFTANDNVDEFNTLKVDAKNLNNMFADKGSEVHKFIQLVLDKRLKVKGDDKHKFDAIFNSVAENLPESIKLRQTIILGLHTVIKDIIKDAEKELGPDFELFPEVSVFNDNIKYDGKPMQGHVDIVAWSPSTNTAWVYDVKTKAEQSYLNFDKPFKKKGPPFGRLSNSKETDTAIQTSMYALFLKHKYNIEVLGSKVAMITNKYGPSDGKPGVRKWNINSVNFKLTEIRKLEPLEGEVREVLTMEKPTPLGEKNSDALIGEIFDNKLVTVTSSKDNFVKAEEFNHVIEKDGKFIWTNVYDKSITIVKETKKDLLKAIGDSYDEYIETKKYAARELVEIFKSGNISKDSLWNTKRLTSRAREILKPFPKKDFTLESASNISGIGDDILIATNNITGEVTIISVTLTYNKEYNFNETTDEGSKTSIYGPFLEDKTVIKKYRKGIIPKATTQNLNKLKLVMLAAELRTLDPVKYANITTILSTSLLEQHGRTYDYVDIEPSLGHLTEIHKLMKDAGKVIPQELEAIVNKSELTKRTALETDHFAIFAKKVQKGLDPLKLLIDNNPTPIKGKKLLSELKKSIRVWEDNAYDLNVYSNISEQLSEYVQTMFGHLILEHKDAKHIYENQSFIAANRAFLSFKNLMVASDPTYRKHILGNINSLTTVGDPTASKVALALSQYEQSARDMILEDMSEHQKLQKDLMAETPGVNLAVSIFDKRNYKKVFHNMMQDGYEFDEKNVNQWMRFKDPSKLNGAQRKYVEFYNKTVKASMETLFGKYKAKEMYSNTSDSAMIDKWGEGFIPIISKDADLDLQEFSLTRQGIDASFEMIQKILAKGGNSPEQKSEEDPWAFSSLFPEQVDGSAGRGSKQTRSLMNITDDNLVIENSRNIEMNPAVIMNVMLVEAARKKHMAMAAFATFSIDAELAYKNSFPGVDTDALRTLIGNIVSIRVHNKVDDDGKVGQLIDSTKNLMSVAMFWGSIRQTVTEVGTSTLQMSSQTIANVINKTLFKGTNRYDNKDLLWAAKFVGKPLGRQVITDLGMYNTSLGEFTDSEYIEMEKKLAFQTKWGMLPIRTVLRQGVQAIVFAQMHKEGIVEKCFVLDPRTGKYHYDETKDDRFYVWDEKLDIEGQQTKGPETDDEITRHKFWLAHRQQLLIEGGINLSNSKMTRPFIMAELQSMKNMAIRMLGSMDNSEAMAFMTSAIGRAFGTYKRWIIQKIANYWTPTKPSFKEGRWDLDSDSNPIWVEEDFEGIIQSVMGLIRNIKELGSVGAAMKDLNSIQQRNLSKLLADLLLTAAIMYLLSFIIDSEFASTAIGKELVRGMGNASSDIMPLIALKDAVTGSPMAAVSIAINTGQNLFRTVGYSATGDFDNALSAADKTMDIVGSWRATKSFSELLTEQ